MGIFVRIFANLAAESGPPDRVLIDSTHSRRIGQPPACSAASNVPAHDRARCLNCMAEV
jgi:hypothetical protein